MNRNKMLCYASLPKGHSFSTTVEHIAKRGFTELSLWMDALMQGIEEQGSIEALRKFLDQHHVKVSILEVLMQWVDGTEGEHLKEAEAYRDNAIALGSELCMAICLNDTINNKQQSYANLRDQCQIMHEAQLKVAVEFLPWTAINNIQAVRECVETVDAPNLGYVLDTWHFARSGQDYTALESLPGDKVFAIQLSDAGESTASLDILTETMGHRLPPGQGSNDWPRLKAWFEANCPDAIIGPEIFSTEIQNMTLEQALDVLWNAGGHDSHGG